LTVRKRREFEITDTELKLIAAAACGLLESLHSILPGDVGEPCHSAIR
jgi:hypothetical protein